MTVVSVDALAITSHAKPWQKPQFTHAGRPLYTVELMASGAGAGCQPSFFAPRSNNTPEDFARMGGIGYGRLRGGSKGCAPATPETPISQSTFV